MKKEIEVKDKIKGVIMKLCWFCKHFYYDNSDYGYGESTPGSDFTIRCNKFKWKFNACITSQEEFGKILSTAEHCKAFRKIIKDNS